MPGEMHDILTAFALVFEPYTVLVMLVSALFGLFVGAVPGLTATTATASRFFLESPFSSCKAIQNSSEKINSARPRCAVRRKWLTRGLSTRPLCTMYQPSTPCRPPRMKVPRSCSDRGLLNRR